MLKANCNYLFNAYKLRQFPLDKMTNILVTGGCGFIGSNLCVYLRKRLKGAHVVALDNLKRRGSELNLPRLKENGVEFRHGDIRNKEDLEFKDLKFSCLVECSADPSVLAGYDESPAYILHTNLMGTIHCLDLARAHQAGFIFLSTNRVYSIEQLSHLGFKETATRLIPNLNRTPGISQKGVTEEFSTAGWRSLYGTTKLASELIIQEYIHGYGLQAVINRLSAISGPWQMGKMEQGVFGYWMINHYFNKGLQYYGFGGEGKQVRDVLHVDDLAELVLREIKLLPRLKGQIFNVGGGKDFSVSLCESTKICQDLTDRSVPIKKIRKVRMADIPYFITDNSKVTKLTGWKPTSSPRKLFSDIHQWLCDNEETVQRTLVKG